MRESCAHHARRKGGTVLHRTLAPLPASNFTSQCRAMRHRLLSAVLALALILDPAHSRSLGENCRKDWSRRGDCGHLACAVIDVPHVQCAPARTTGQKCLDYGDCETDLYCRPDPQNICSPRVNCPAGKSGAHCVKDHPLDKGMQCNRQEECEEDAYCEKVCTARRAKGETCKRDVACDDGLSCVSSFCVTHPKAGESCKSRIVHSFTDMRESNCAGSLACVNSKCVAPIRGDDSLKPSSGPGGEVPGNFEETDNGLKPGSSQDVKMPGKSEETEKAGLDAESKIGLAVGVPSIILSAVGVALGYKQLRTGRLIVTPWGGEPGVTGGPSIPV